MTRCLGYDQKPDYEEIKEIMAQLRDDAEEGPLDLTNATIIEKEQIISSRDAATKKTFKTTEKVSSGVLRDK